MAIRTKLTLKLLLVAVCVQTTSCGTIYSDSSSPVSTVSPPANCFKPTKLFEWLSIRAKMISWTKGNEANNVGTLAVVFTITNNDRSMRQ
jgi:hypothetical protein